MKKHKADPKATKATIDNVVSRPIISYKNFDRSEWLFNGQRVCVENATWPRNPFRTQSVVVEYWLNGNQATPEAMKEMLVRLGLDPSKYHIEQEFYGDGYFCMCSELEDAIAYFNATEGRK